MSSYFVGISVTSIHFDDFIDVVSLSLKLVHSLLNLSLNLFELFFLNRAFSPILQLLLDFLLNESLSKIFMVYIH